MKYKLLLWRICAIALILSLFPCSLSNLFADEADDLQKEVENWKVRYQQDLAKLKEKLQQLKDRQAKQRKTIPHTFDRLLDKYLKQGTEPVSWTNFLSPKNRIKFYGFMRLDIDYDSNRTNNGNIASFVRNYNSDQSDEDEELNIHARYTRFGLELRGTPLLYLGNPELSGRIEVDFLGGGSESRNLIRMRHAYLRLDWTQYDFYVLAGQGSEIIAPLSPFTVEAAVPFRNRGNPGERRPGLAFGYKPTISKIQDQDLKLSLQAGIYRTEATGAQDIDGDGNNDGEDSGLPMVQWRAGAIIPAIVKNKPITFGIYGAHGWEEGHTEIGTNGKSDFISLMLGLDVQIPIHERVTIAGEFFWGRNVNDLLAGIGQSIDTFHGKEIDTLGGWISAKVKATDMLSVSFGYAFDNPQDEDVEDFGAAGRRFVSTAFINNVWDFGSGVYFGYEYQYMLTYFNRNDLSNHNNRGIVYIMYKW